MAKIEARVVFNQTVVQFQQLTGAGHYLQPSHPVTGHSVANNLNAPGISSNVTPDLTRPA